MQLYTANTYTILLYTMLVNIHSLFIKDKSGENYFVAKLVPVDSGLNRIGSVEGNIKNHKRTSSGSE